MHGTNQHPTPVTKTFTVEASSPDAQTSLDEEWLNLLRWAGAELADPMTDPALRDDLEVILGTFDVFLPHNRATVDPGLRVNLLDTYRNPPPPGGMYDAVSDASMDVAYRNGRKVAW